MSSHDPLSDLLRPPPHPAPFPRLREAVLEQTLSVLRRHRRRKQLASVAALVALCGVGLWLVLEGLAGTGELAPRPRAEPVAVASPAPGPVELEWKALEQPDEAARLYREAGDGYLQERDPANAVRAYGNALDGAAPQDLDDNVNDSWLLTAIKIARKKEKVQCE